ncbi:MAG TPA: hypothetical protein P5244_04555 [Syntrophales bacterium]|nr:hypothetical protein [Syntrophales bacterium]
MMLLIRKIVNIALPLLGIGIMVYYSTCNVACTNLSGTLMGIDLQHVGISLMLVMAISNMIVHPVLRHCVMHIRTAMLFGALGGEVVLVRFQILHGTYCPYCLAFMACLVVMLGANIGRHTNWRIAGACLLAGMIVLGYGFEGHVGPMLYITN